MVTACALAFFAHILLHTVWLGPEKAEGHSLQGLGQGFVYEEQDWNKRLRCTGIVPGAVDLLLKRVRGCSQSRSLAPNLFVLRQQAELLPWS